jgi:hypothetical protein
VNVPAAVRRKQAPPPGPVPPPGPKGWLRRAIFGRQDHMCQCGHPRLVHVHLRYAECLRCGCTAFIRGRQP